MDFGNIGLLVVIGIVAFVLLAIIGVYVTKYRTAGPDEALIVTGSYLGSKTYIQTNQVIELKLSVVVVHSYFLYSSKQNH